jgi:hypothetical protein
MPKGTARADRRDKSPAGVAGRSPLDESLRLIASLGLSPQAIDYYRRAAAEARRMPHEMLREVAERAAQAPTGKAPGSPPRR